MKMVYAIVELGEGEKDKAKLWNVLHSGQRVSLIIKEVLTHVLVLWEN